MLNRHPTVVCYNDHKFWNQHESCPLEAQDTVGYRQGNRTDDGRLLVQT